jgi:plasmid stabilization system protein ParE
LIVRFTPLALSDLEQYHAFVAESNPPAARKLIERITTAAPELGTFPQARPTWQDRRHS